MITRIQFDVMTAF